MTKPEERVCQIGLQWFADNGSADDGTPADGNAEEQFKAAFGGAGTDGQKPADKPEGNADAGGTKTEGDIKLAAWTEQLPPEMRTNAETAAKIAKFAKVGDMAKAFLELETKAANGGIPGKDATAEELAAFWEKAGRPKTSEGYSFAKDKENNGAVFADAAFKANLTAAQAEALYKSQLELGKAMVQKHQQDIAQSEKNTLQALIKEFGSKYSAKMEYLSRGLQAAGPNTANLLQQAGLHCNPEIIKAFILVGEMTAESGFAKGGSAGDSLKSLKDGGSPEFKTN